MSQRRWTAEQMQEQTGRVAVVTGANSGIGFETARALLAKGAHVVLACRSEVRGAEAVSAIKREHPEAAAEMMPLDLSNLASVQGFVETFRGRFDRLDLLINNAGVMMTPETRTGDGFELQFGTNHLGHFALTGRLFDLLRGTPEARVVTVSSIAHRYGTIDFDDLNWERRPYKPRAAYGQSKLANLLFTVELVRRCASSGIDVLAAASHPGWTRTNLQRHAGLLRFLNPFFGMEPWQGALPSLFAATAENAVAGAYYGPDGWLGMKGYPKRADTTDTAKDAAAAERLWTVSEELTGVRFTMDAAAWVNAGS